VRADQRDLFGVDAEAAAAVRAARRRFLPGENLVGLDSGGDGCCSVLGGFLAELRREIYEV